MVRYRLVPQGSYSTVERLLPGGAIESYELFLPQESFSRIWLVRHYNSAMTGFLACLDQLAAYVKSLDPNFRLNYRCYAPTPALTALGSPRRTSATIPSTSSTTRIPCGPRR